MNSPQLTLNVFVYGTLKPGEVNYQRYCKTQIRTQIEAYTWGNLYDLHVGYPAMVEGQNKVRGILMSFDNEKVLCSLDQLEGYQEQRAANLNEYYRQSIVVYSSDDQFLGNAWAYFMTMTKVRQYGGILINSGIWSGSTNNRT